jgi:hypothetical protein
MILGFVPEIEINQSALNPDTHDVIVYHGKIHSIVDGRYGFIENGNFPDNVFFSGAALLPGVRMSDLLRGQDIVFELEASITNDVTRVKAKSVWFPDT